MAEILLSFATTLGVVMLFMGGMYFCYQLFDFMLAKLLELFEAHKYLTQYIWDKMHGNIRYHISIIFVTSDNGWEACYMNGEKTHEGEQISLWSNTLCKLGCCVTHRFVQQEWLDKCQGSYPRRLLEVEFDDEICKH